jgi:hypothetical protein
MAAAACDYRLGGMPADERRTPIATRCSALIAWEHRRWARLEPIQNRCRSLRAAVAF